MSKSKIQYIDMLRERKAAREAKIKPESLKNVSPTAKKAVKTKSK